MNILPAFVKFRIFFSVVNMGQEAGCRVDTYHGHVKMPNVPKEKKYLYFHDYRLLSFSHVCSPDPLGYLFVRGIKNCKKHFIELPKLVCL